MCSLTRAGSSFSKTALALPSSGGYAASPTPCGVSARHQPASPLKRKVTGTVTDSNGVPVPNAQGQIQVEFREFGTRLLFIPTVLADVTPSMVVTSPPA